MIAFVLAAGFGTRFRPATLTTPKPLLPLAGRPILFHVFDHLLRQGADRFVVNAHHLAQALRAAAPESYAGVPVAWSVEEEILGTAGGIRRAHARGLLADTFLVANGDVLTTLPLGRLLAGRHEPGVVSALAVLPNEQPERDTPLWATPRAVSPRSAARGPPARRVRGSSRACRPRPRRSSPRIPEGVAELAKDVLVPSAAARDGAFALVPYARSDGLWFDLGTPERLAAAEASLPR